MHVLGPHALRLGILLAAATSTPATVALWGAGTARSFAVFVVSTGLAVVVATLLEPIVRGTRRGA